MAYSEQRYLLWWEHIIPDIQLAERTHKRLDWVEAFASLILILSQHQSTTTYTDYTVQKGLVIATFYFILKATNYCIWSLSVWLRRTHICTYIHSSGWYRHTWYSATHGQTLSTIRSTSIDINPPVTVCTPPRHTNVVPPAVVHRWTVCDPFSPVHIQHPAKWHKEKSSS